MGMPEKLRRLLADFGVSEATYDEWVAGHEAAHAVISHVLGGEVKKISLCGIDEGGSYSRATTEWSAAELNGLNLIHVIAAGPAYDNLFAESIGIPPEFIQHVDKDRQTADEYLRIMLKPEKHGGIPETWEWSIQQMVKSVQEHHADITTIQVLILDAIAAGQEVITGDQFRQALS